MRIRTVQGYAKWLTGAVATGRRLCGEALALARSLEHPQSMTWALTLAGALPAAMWRDARRAQAFAEEVLSLSDSARSPTDIGWARVYGGWARGVEGEIREGIESLRAGLAILRDHKATVFRPHQLALLTELYLVAEDRELARDALHEAWDALEDSEERVWEAELHRLDGERLAGIDNPAEAEHSFAQAMAVARSRGLRSLELRAATSLARCLTAWDRRDEVSALLRPIFGAFAEGFHTGDLHDAAEALAALDTR